MRKTIAGKILINILTAFVLFIVILSVWFYYDTKSTILDTEKQLCKVYLLEIENFAETMMSEPGKKLEGETIELLKKQTQKMCEKYDLNYIMLYVPDVENGTAEYKVVSAGHGKEEQAEKDWMNHTDHTLKQTLVAKEQDLLEGKREFAFFIYMNEHGYGHQLEGEMLLSDSVGNQMIACVGFPFEVLTKMVNERFLYLLAAAFFVLLLMLLSIYFLLYTSVSKPAARLAHVLKHYIADGEKQNIQLEVKGEDEFAVLSKAYNHMSQEIDTYIQNITLLTQKQERIRNEMQFAGEIQQGLLPSDYKKTNDFSIYAKMVPAKNIGGDLYDYQQLDENRTLFVIADVSGKGISASMFMGITLTLIRQLARLEKSTSEILTITNNTLVEHNPQMLFVTVFVAIYDRRSRSLTYTNAGHNLPYLLRRELVELSDARELPLGLFEDITYPETAVQIEEQDILFLYTDGVNEAANKEKSFYGIKQLEEKLSAYRSSQSENLIDWIYDSVKDFAGEAEQSDDITMMAIDFRVDSMK